MFADHVTVVSDSNLSSSGAFITDSSSTLHLLAGGGHFDVTSHSIDLLCNVTGGGDLTLSCDQCEMVIGGNTNYYVDRSSYHISNDVLSRVLNTGEVTLGSRNSDLSNVTEVLVDDLNVSLASSLFSISSSAGPVSFLNLSSHITLTSDEASIGISAAGNVSVEADLTVQIRNSR